MIIEMTPHLRIETLDMGIEGCRRCYKHGEQRRIERIDIADMHYRSLMLEQMAYPIRYHYNAYHNKEDDEVDIGEDGDELRDRIVGHHLVKKLRLTSPAEARIFGSQFHPHRVDATASMSCL